jgi:formylglycine-generating enzyme required for sulfatase activity
MNVRIPIALLLVIAGAPAASAQSTASTYQGKLSDGANPANGAYDMQGLDGNHALAQARRKPTRQAGTQAAHRPGAPPLLSCEFDTVSVDARGKITSRRKGRARYYVENISGLRLEMVEIPGGSFTMGSNNARYTARHAEQPAHQVNVPRFYMGKYEVTQAQWRAVAKLPKVNRDLNPDPSEFKGDNLPVERVKWADALEFCARLYRATGRIYRLPSEAEWEYACRAGTTTEFAFGENITPELVNYDGNSPYGSAPKGMSRKHTTPVGSIGVANGFGLYDMHGNVEEWCMDIYHDTYEDAPADGSSWDDPSKVFIGYQDERMTRGGYWSYTAEICRSAHRNRHGLYYSDADLGFRVVATPQTGVVGTQEEHVESPASVGQHDDNELQHDWNIYEAKNGVNYVSNHPAPVPFSYSQEPEATLATESVKISARPPSLSAIVNSEIKKIRKELQLAEYLEDDGHKPQGNIVSWVEEIDGHRVAFIRYRTSGVKGGPPVLPRTSRHAILIKNGTLHFIHLTVLFARHQQEVRDDQIRLVKRIIRK